MTANFPTSIRWQMWRVSFEQAFDTWFTAIISPLLALVLGKEVRPAKRPPLGVRRFMLLTYPITGFGLWLLIGALCIIWFVLAILVLLLLGIGNLIVNMAFD